MERRTDCPKLNVSLCVCVRVSCLFPASWSNEKFQECNTTQISCEEEIPGKLIYLQVEHRMELMTALLVISHKPLHIIFPEETPLHAVLPSVLFCLLHSICVTSLTPVPYFQLLTLSLFVPHLPLHIPAGDWGMYHLFVTVFTFSDSNDLCLPGISTFSACMDWGKCPSQERWP